MKYKVGDKVRFIKPIRVNGEYGYVNKDVIFTISYFDYKEKTYWIGNMVFGAKMLEEITEPVATKNFTGALIERIKGEGQDEIQSW
jgi:hypothetical protein